MPIFMLQPAPAADDVVAPSPAPARAGPGGQNHGPADPGRTGVSKFDNPAGPEISKSAARQPAGRWLSSPGRAVTAICEHLVATWDGEPQELVNEFNRHCQQFWEGVAVESDRCLFS